MTNRKTNIHGTALEGKAHTGSTEEQQTLAARNRAITEALAELKVRSRS